MLAESTCSVSLSVRHSAASHRELRVVFTPRAWSFEVGFAVNGCPAVALDHRMRGRKEKNGLSTRQTAAH
ncbi:hypothetical protein MTO96_015254 [Rhipicephalus appendiculatus]